MQRLLDAIKAKPYLWSILLLVIFFGFLTIIQVPVQILVRDEVAHYDYRGFLAGTAFSQLLLAAVAILLIRALGIGKPADFSRPKFKGILLAWLGWLFMLAMLGLNIAGVPEGQLIFAIFPFLLTVLMSLSTGILEEVLVRGLTFNLLRRKLGIKGAVLLSSLFFGLAHYFNLLGGGDFLTVTVQVIYAFFIGIYLAALYVRTKTLWVPILVHAAIDFQSFVLYAIVSAEGFRELESQAQGTAAGAGLINLVITLPFLLAGLWMLRKKKLAQLD